MSPKLKAILWSLSLITIVYVSKQYVEIQRLKTAQRAERSSQKDQAYKITQVGGQVMRVNESTGETYYWSTDGGGWVKIDGTNLMTTVSEAERKERIATIKMLYELLVPDQKETISYETFEGGLINTPSWQLREQLTKHREQIAKATNSQTERVPFEKNELLQEDTQTGIPILNGILWDPRGNSVAMLNDKERKVGDMIGSYKVVAIQRLSVILEDLKGARIEVKLETTPDPKRTGGHL